MSVLARLAVIVTVAASTAAAADVKEAPRLIAAAELGVGRMVPDIEFTPVAGKAVRLSEVRPAKAVVIAFTSTTCPVAKRYGPTLAKLEAEFAGKGVQFVFINPVASETPEQVRTAARELRLKGPYVRDAGLEVAKALGARSTTEVFVVDVKRTLIYRGAVDDQYGLGYSLDEPKQRYLAAAIEAALDGRQPAVAATTAPGCELETGGAPRDVALTYHGRISRIVQSNCVECHRDGGVGPFALETYEQVVSYAGMIRRQVDKGVMPPWFAAPSHAVVWANDRSLPAADKAALLAWLSGDKKVGDPADAPVARVYTKEWEIGRPDAIVRIPKPIDVKATGAMPYQNVEAPTNFTEDKWVSAIEVRPTARQVVHHVLVFVVPRRREDRPSRPAARRRRRRELLRGLRAGEQRAAVRRGVREDGACRGVAAVPDPLHAGRDGDAGPDGGGVALREDAAEA
jgi:peroxiredoxin